jgi:PKD repeat protein
MTKKRYISNGWHPRIASIENVTEQVTADFSATPTSGVAPLMVEFTNLSSGDYDSCSWDFGDGGDSSDCSNPSYTYDIGGVFTVSLTVTGAGGTHTETKTNLVSVEEYYYVFVPVVLKP